MKRRTLLKVGAIAAAGVGLISISRVMLESFESLIYSILKSDLGVLNVTDVDLKKYAKDASANNPFGFSSAKIKMIAAYNQLHILGINRGPYHQKYVQYRATIVGNFLLSTNFFWEKLKETDKISYSGRIYTPYSYPCGNPFSNIFYPSPA